MKPLKQLRKNNLIRHFLLIILACALSSYGLLQKKTIHNGYIVGFGPADSLINQVVAQDSLESKFHIEINRDNSCDNCFYVHLFNSICLDSASVEKELLSKTNVFYNAGNDLFIPVILSDLTNLVQRKRNEGVRHTFCGQGLVYFKYNSLTREQRKW